MSARPDARPQAAPRAPARFGIVGALVRRLLHPQVNILAGYMAYTGMLSLLPFLIFASALAGLIIGPEGTEAAVEGLFDVVPDHVALTLEPVLREVLGRQRGDLLTVSALGAIWAASSGIEALRVAFDRAYGVPEGRHIAVNRLISLGLVLAGSLTFLALGLLIVVAPLAFHVVELWLGVTVPRAADVLRYLIGGGMLAWFLWLAHRILPARVEGPHRLWPGILLSIALAGLAATGLSVFLAHAPNYAVSYGTLAGVIITLLFFYLTGIALIAGAELNGVLAERAQAAGETPAEDADD